jgi:hypothetical protein
MIERIEWPEPRRGELANPFLRGTGEVPLRLTFHDTALCALPPQEAEALAALHDLARHPLLEVVHTDAGDGPHLETVAGYPASNQYVAYIKHRGDTVRYWYIRDRDQLPAVAAHLAVQADPQHPDSRAMFADLLVALAHAAVRQHLLVTCSPWLLRHRNAPEVLDANPRRPSEAARIVGLFLRSRDDYSYQAEGGSLPHVPDLDRIRYFHTLVRERLPSIGRYLSAVGYTERTARDGRYDVARGVVTRCIRALQARDAIGELFYTSKVPTLDRILYHFDYLTLPLNGALDAQARVAYRVHGITRPPIRRVNFHNSDFRNELRNKKVSALLAIVQGKRYEDTLALLHELRNTIHHAALDARLSGPISQGNAIAVIVPKDIGDGLWAAAMRQGGATRWGVTRGRSAMGNDEYLVEPYSYAVALVDHCFLLINAIAAKTKMPLPRNATAEVNHLGKRTWAPESVRRRIEILG